MPLVGLVVRWERVCGVRVRSRWHAGAQQVDQVGRGEIRQVGGAQLGGQEAEEKRSAGRDQPPSEGSTSQEYESSSVVVRALVGDVSQGQGSGLEHQAAQGAQVLQQVSDHDLFEAALEAGAR